MRIAIIPAKDITAAKGLNARKYIPAKPKLGWRQQADFFTASAGGIILKVFLGNKETWCWEVHRSGLFDPVLVGLTDSKAQAQLDAEAGLVEHAKNTYRKLMKTMGVK